MTPLHSKCKFEVIPIYVSIACPFVCIAIFDLMGKEVDGECRVECLGQRDRIERIRGRGAMVVEIDLHDTYRCAVISNDCRFEVTFTSNDTGYDERGDLILDCCVLNERLNRRRRFCRGGDNRVRVPDGSGEAHGQEDAYDGDLLCTYPMCYSHPLVTTTGCNAGVPCWTGIDYEVGAGVVVEDGTVRPR